MHPIQAQLVLIAADDVHLEALLEWPPAPKGLVVFAEGGVSTRHNPRHHHVAKALHTHGMATLLPDLMTLAEDLDYQTHFDIPLLTHRLLVATRWTMQNENTRSLRLGYFGANTGATAALHAAAGLGAEIHAVVSRGGRPDLAGHHDLAKVSAPTLLLVGALDEEGVALNEAACAHLPSTKRLSVIGGAGHLFDEAGALDTVAEQTTDWFTQHLLAPH
jgi:putative phosphoribosyl transferase